MATPNLAVTLEPSDGGNVVFLRLAPRERGSARKAQLSLTAAIRNNEPGPVHVTQLTVSFPDRPALGSTVIPRAIDIPSGGQSTAFFEEADNIVLPFPAPDRVRLSITCDGFADPWAVTANLRRHVSPVTDGSYLFPARASDIDDGEFWQGIGAHHGSGFGSQLFAYDMIVVRRNSESNQWDDLRPGMDRSENDHFLIYGKPVYAMADGTVVGFRNDIAENAHPGDARPPNTPVEGDHFWIQHGTEVVLYAHLQPASMTPELLSIGAAVTQGQLLGKAGNSGNSSGPHLHIHAMSGNTPWGGPLRPLPFRRTQMLDRSLVTGSSRGGPWVELDGDGPPDVVALIWPDVAAGRFATAIRAVIDKIVAFVRWFARLVKFPLGPDPVPNRK